MWSGDTLEFYESMSSHWLNQWIFRTWYVGGFLKRLGSEFGQKDKLGWVESMVQVGIPFQIWTRPQSWGHAQVWLLSSFDFSLIIIKVLITTSFSVIVVDSFFYRVIVREGILVQILQTNSADSEGRGRAQALSWLPCTHSNWVDWTTLNSWVHEFDLSTPRFLIITGVILYSWQ